MSKNIVKYSNEFNVIGIRSMSKLENDVFYALIYKLQDQQKQEVNLTLTELKCLIGKSQEKNILINEALLKMAEKFSHFVAKYKNNKTTKFFSVFEILEVPDAEPKIKAKLSKPFLHLINDLSSEYTLIDLAQYTAIRSKYTQTIYRLLKQFSSTGYYKIAWKDFLEQLDLPEKLPLGDITRTIDKAIKELEYKKIFKFKKFKSKGGAKGYLKSKHTKGKGNRISHIEFYFNKNEKSKFDELQDQENTTPKNTRYAESVANREKLLDNQKAKQQIKQHNIAALAAGCNALKVDEPQEEREDRIKKEVQRMNMSTIMKAYAGRWFTYNNTSYKIDNFEFSADGELVLFVRLEDNTPARYMHEFESINHFENYVKDYLI